MYLDFGAKYGRFYHGLKLHIVVEAISGLMVTPASEREVVHLTDIGLKAKNQCQT